MANKKVLTQEPIQRALEEEIDDENLLPGDFNCDGCSEDLLTVVVSNLITEYVGNVT